MSMHPLGVLRGKPASFEERAYVVACMEDGISVSLAALRERFPEARPRHFMVAAESRQRHDAVPVPLGLLVEMFPDGDIPD